MTGCHEEGIQNSVIMPVVNSIIHCTLHIVLQSDGKEPDLGQLFLAYLLLLHILLAELSHCSLTSTSLFISSMFLKYKVA